MRIVFKSIWPFLFAATLIYISCAKEFSYEGGHENQPPVAIAGRDTIITLPADSAHLNGTASYDPDGVITKYTWKKISGPDTLFIPNTTVAKTVVKKLVPGVYQFELQVTDNDGFSSKDTIEVTVDKVLVNHAPIADAGPDQTIIVPASETVLDGSASWDPDNNIVGYAWTKISGPSSLSLSDPVGVQSKATNLILGDYFFELVVTDAGGLSSKDTVKISVQNPPGELPIADAGPDITVHYNLQICSMDPSSITLDGSDSHDPDGTIVSYQWSLLFGDNTSPIILNPNAAVTMVTDLLPGNYAFKLVVTDNSGAMDADTVLVTTEYINRPTINASLIPIGSLSENRRVSAVAAANGKILFAGGNTQPTGFPPPIGPNYSSRVDIYDIATGSWSTAELSEARTDISAVTSGDNIYFSGGTAYGGATSRIDVYDATTNFWKTVEMPSAGTKLASIAMGSTIYIAGGNDLNIYDSRLKKWTIKKLSQYRTLITPVLVKKIPNVVVSFMGGLQSKSSGLLSSRIDTYDPVTDVMSVSELSEPKYGMIVTGNILAGGTTPNGITNKVEGVAGCLFQPNSFSYYSYGKVNNDLVFFVWDGKEKSKFDIFNISTGTWSIGVLEQAITPSLIISVDDTIYVVGAYGSNGGYHNQVWKLQF